MRLRPRRAAVLLGLWAGAVVADPPAEPPLDLGPVTITATRSAQPAYEEPASVDSVAGAEFTGDRLGLTLAEGVLAIPGLLARDRQDYAQDLQLSIRGFGANSTFGILGVRLYIDGIPATQPDGQGASTNFNFPSAERVEVLRGPFSALYGNSAGGVVQIFTADGAAPPHESLDAAGGSYGTWRVSAAAAGAGYSLGLLHFASDGYRSHSQAKRDSANGKFDFVPDANSKLSLLVNVFSAPEVLDPQGLSPQQFAADPRQAVTASSQFNTRKSAEQEQVGAVYERKLTEDQSLRLLSYYGERRVRQFLSIPVVAQSNPLSSGGVIGLNNDYGGGDLRWTLRAGPAERPFTLVGGVSYDLLVEHRRGFENFAGAQTGVQGALRRDEIDRVYNLDEYLQADWRLSQQWSALAGIRHSEVRFSSSDHYITATNPDDSGRVSYRDTTPVAGLMYRAASYAHLYAAYGEGFQTPSFDQLAYRPGGGSGLNFGLLPERDGSAELGAKLRWGAWLQGELAGFRALTRNELAVATNANGRATYQNAGRTRRQGLEAALTARLASTLKLRLAYTYLDATVRQVAAGSTLTQGERLPGVPESDVYGELRWGGDTGWHAAVNGQYLGRVPVNDSNSVSAPDYALLGADLGYALQLTHCRLRAYLRADNLLDTAYVGAVGVDDGNSRYFFPGSGRSVLAGVGITYGSL